MLRTTTLLTTVLALVGCSNKELEMQISNMQSANQSLTRRITQLEQEKAQLQGQLAEAASVKIPTGISAVPVARRNGGGTAAPIAATDGGYQQAYALFQAGDLDSAIAAFEYFLQNGGSGEEAQLAQYWLGESYYNKRNYDLAGRYYAAYLRMSPQGGRSQQALQKLIESLRAQGRTQDAEALRQQGVSALVQ